MDNEELINQFQQMSADLKAYGENMPYFMVRNIYAWNILMRDCTEHRVIEIYDDICEITELLIGHLSEMSELELYCLSHLEYKQDWSWSKIPNEHDMAVEEIVDLVKQAKLSDYPNLEKNIKSLPEENHNRRSFPHAIMHVIKLHSWYFKILWGENQDIIDKKRPQEILMSLDEKYHYRAVVSALISFHQGKIGWMDSAGGRQ